MNKKFILKLNFFAFLYAFVLTVQSLLMINVYRLERITHWLNFRVNGLFILVIFILSTVVFFLITIKYLNAGKLRYLLVLLWVPYYFAFYKLSWILMPITDHGDKATPVTGLVIMAMCILYPVYIANINFLSTVIAEIKKGRHILKKDK